MTSASFTDPDSRRTETILHRFNDVFMQHDPAPLQDLVADDCRIENTQPAPDGALYEGGLVIRTTLDPRLQAIAERALRNGLVEYDRRHGWRGPLGHVEPAENWIDQLETIPTPKGLHNWNFAMVLAVDGKGADIGVAGGATFSWYDKDE